VRDLKPFLPQMLIKLFENSVEKRNIGPHSGKVAYSRFGGKQSPESGLPHTIVSNRI